MASLVIIYIAIIRSNENKKLSLDTIAQIGVSIFGVTAIILVAKKNKWGFVFGLLSEPFWLITTYMHKQWGVFFLTIIYGGTWAYGVYEWFYKDTKTKEKA